MILLMAGCAYTFGGGLVAGALDEAQGKGRSDGLEGPLDRVLERQLLTELGHQLGQGLTSGATEIDPEQQARLEKTIDELITVATRRAGNGIRTEVSPELREMVQKDIVRALADGMRGEFGDSLKETVDGVVTRAIVTLRRELRDEETRQSLSDLFRDSIYFAMEEDAVTPGVSNTLKRTITDSMLVPIEQTATGLDYLVADRLDKSRESTERTLKNVIGGLIFVLGVLVVVFFVRSRQVRRLTERSEHAERNLKGLDVAIEALDPENRALLQRRLDELRRLDAPAPTPLASVTGARSDDYMRGNRPRSVPPGSSGPRPPKPPPKDPPAGP